VGKLLYALAKADGQISTEEINEIHQLVLKDLVPLEDSSDEFGTDSAYYVEMEFDFLNENSYDPDVAFDSFISYVEDHYTAFDERLKTAIMDVAETLINSFHSTSIKDHNYMVKLRQTLKKNMVS
jgi:hypothetical protein